MYPTLLPGPRPSHSHDLTGWIAVLKGQLERDGVGVERPATLDIKARDFHRRVKRSAEELCRQSCDKDTTIE